MDARGWGGLVTTEVDRVPLGSHHGHDLHARVERRSARLSAGHDWHLSVGLARTRPVAIEVDGGGTRYDLSIHTTDPWMRLARRIVALVLASAALLVIAGCVRARSHAPKEATRGN